jgi:hypothetical protein
MARINGFCIGQSGDDACAHGMKAWLFRLAILLPTLLQADFVRYEDDFRQGLGQWIVEQQKGGMVGWTPSKGVLFIEDAGGCTVWFRERLHAPLVIRYTARMSSAARVSDLNCFWMADDPARPGDLFGAGHGRDGKFAAYDSLRTYYVGCGGNANTTTRFRRYDGSGARPLLPEHELTAREFLLVPDREYRIELSVTKGGRVQYRRDGVVFFDWQDPDPLRSGWFGFRTVDSRMEIRDFRVHAAAAPTAGEAGR